MGVHYVFKHCIFTGFILSMVSLLGCQASTKSSLSLSGTGQVSSSVKILAGTYSQKGSEGIYSFSYDAHNKQFSEPVLLAKDQNPSFIHIEQNNVYVVNEIKRGRLTTYRLTDNGLNQVASEATKGASPCYVSMSPDKKFIATANYMGGNVSVFNLDHDGIPLSDPQILQHSGSGANKSRQEAAHVHWVQWDQDQTHLYVVDLGIDEVKVYPFSKVDGIVGLGKTALKLSPGNGPRHLYFHPTKPFAYILNELSNTVTVAIKRSDGLLAPIQQVDTLPSAFTGHNQGGHIYINKAANTLYASNRGHDSIAVFSIAGDGKLTLIDMESTRGNWPRHFLVLEDLSTVLVANQESNNIVALAIQKDGTLSATSAELDLAQVTFLGRL